MAARGARGPGAPSTRRRPRRLDGLVPRNLRALGAVPRAPAALARTHGGTLARLRALLRAPPRARRPRLDARFRLRRALRARDPLDVAPAAPRRDAVGGSRDPATARIDALVVHALRGVDLPGVRARRAVDGTLGPQARRPARGDAPARRVPDGAVRRLVVGRLAALVELEADLHRGARTECAPQHLDE